MVKYSVDQWALNLLAGIFGFLILASCLSLFLKKKVKTEDAKSTVENLIARIKAWWVIVFVFSAAMLMGSAASILLFTFISVLALREFIGLNPSIKRSDRRALIWAFFVILPLNYFLLGIKWYGLFAIFIPVYAFLFIPIRYVMSDDYESFFERVARIQWGLMVYVYFVSYAPALLILEIPDFTGQNIKLLLFLVIIVQLNDVFQYIFGKIFGKIKIIPHISPNKTGEGFLGGILVATLSGALLWQITPFTPLQSSGLAFVIALIGFFGGATMSAIKRDYGVKDYGTLIRGHGGMIDRIDSLCFAAPVFFHLIRYYFSST